ncbi:hypothetical protein [Shewanella sp.]|uniref:hypothetical protein n=1 Tax=Shewanella sp. TaxID=50422 RepID=UPI0025858FBA|nr:hypothetical protein [Shewanella sp.]MCJ8305107.1 hypothetical protein [Shewanella sp.]
MNTLKTRHGVVMVSLPFSSIHHDQKQIELKYTPNNYNGWGICRYYDAGDVRHFTQPDAEAFAQDAETKLRTQGAAV